MPLFVVHPTMTTAGSRIPRNPCFLLLLLFILNDSKYVAVNGASATASSSSSSTSSSSSMNSSSSSSMMSSSFSSCQVCGCDGCVGPAYDTMSRPGGSIPIPPELTQTGMFAGASELQCFWLPFDVDLFLAGLDFCTDDTLRLNGDFRERCGCSAPPIGVTVNDGSLADLMADLVDDPVCNVCGSGGGHVDNDLSATFTVPADKVEIFPTSILKDALKLDDGSVVLKCQTVETAGLHHHFAASTCSAIADLAEFRDGCTCVPPAAADDDDVCNVCGCPDCPSDSTVKMSNPGGSMTIPPEFQELAGGITEIDCWMIDYAVSQGGLISKDECTMFQTFAPLRASCGCPPLLPATKTADGDAVADANVVVVANEARNSKNGSKGPALAIALSLTAVAVVAVVVGLVMLKKKKKKSIVVATKTIAMAAPDEELTTMDDSLDGSALPARSPEKII